MANLINLSSLRGGNDEVIRQKETDCHNKKKKNSP